MLSCLISAYSLSALYLDGVRNSENQTIASGSALTVAGLAFSYATPVHPEQGSSASIDFPSSQLLSLAGQHVIHPSQGYDLRCPPSQIHNGRRARVSHG